MKKILAILATAFLGIGLATLAVAGPASAHDNVINASAACNTADGTWTVTWSVSNDYPEGETIQSSSPAVVPINTIFGAKGSATATQTFTQTGITSPQAITLTVGAHWSGNAGDDYTGSDSGNITAAQFVGGCSVPKTPVTIGTFNYVDPTCAVPTGSYTVPVTANVTYTPSVGASGIAPLTKVTVTAVVTDPTKYVLTGDSSWTHTFTAVPTNCTHLIQPVQPTVSVITACNTEGSVTWTDIPGTIHYALTVGDGKSGPYEVTAYAEGNNIFAGGVSSVVVKSGDLGTKTTCATAPSDEKVSPVICVQDTINDTATKTGGSITVTPITGIQYTITGGTIAPANPVVVSGQTGAAPIVTKLPAGDYVVTPAALTGYTLTNPGAVKLSVLDNAGLCIPTLPFTQGTVGAVSQTCSSGKLVSGYITAALDPDTLSYSLNGVQLGAKTNVAPGTYVVDMTPVKGFSIAAPSATVVVHPASTSDCGELTTLAFTGGNLVGAGFLASSALLFMASGIFLARSRKQKMA
jgi:hypothetical protein